MISAGFCPRPPLSAGTVDVLNGIAFEEQKGRLFVTGKLWPALFEVELVPRPAFAPAPYPSSAALETWAGARCHR
jgi:hypothetical protein